MTLHSLCHQLLLGFCDPDHLERLLVLEPRDAKLILDRLWLLSGVRQKVLEDRLWLHYRSVILCLRAGVLG